MKSVINTRGPLGPVIFSGDYDSIFFRGYVSDPTCQSRFGIILSMELLLIFSSSTLESRRQSHVDLL